MTDIIGKAKILIMDNKEEAKELVERFENLDNHVGGLSRPEAKACALIAVEREEKAALYWNFKSNHPIIKKSYAALKASIQSL